MQLAFVCRLEAARSELGTENRITLEFLNADGEAVRPGWVFTWPAPSSRSFDNTWPNTTFHVQIDAIHFPAAGRYYMHVVANGIELIAQPIDARLLSNT